jgi:hypothetical protein
MPERKKSMKLYITLRSIPQFANLPKKKLRERYRTYYPKLLRHWLTWVTLGIGSMLVVTLEWFIRDGFEELQIQRISMWCAILLRIGLYLIMALLYRIVFYGIIAVYVNQEVNMTPSITC